MSYYVSTDLLDSITNAAIYTLPLRSFLSLQDARDYCSAQIRKGQVAMQTDLTDESTIPVCMQVLTQKDNQRLYEYYGRIVK